MKTLTAKTAKDMGSFTVWENIRFFCHFVPLLTTLAWGLYAIPDLPITVIDYFLVPLMILGWIAAIIARPLEIIKLVGRLAGKGFLVGLLIPIIPVNLFLAVIIGGAGLVAVAALLLFAPGALTIFCFVKEMI